MNNVSFWERTIWLEDVDYAIVGSGIVGLSAALWIREQKPEAKIVILEKGILPSGASTKNAGFACFGSVSEILDDLNTHSEDEVIGLIRKRYTGLQRLRNVLSDHSLGMEWHGGYELFPESEKETFSECIDKLEYINQLAREAISSKKDVFLLKKDPFSFKNTEKQLIFNQFEGQLDTGLMMKNLIQKAHSNGILILNSIRVESFSHEGNELLVETDPLGSFSPKNLLIATNGFANELIQEEVQPARAQVLITHPIKDLHLRGTFHLDRGYYYFRNVGNRILFGGGRNLDKAGETTTSLMTTALIQNRLEELLETVILPGHKFSIDQRWSGIMGVGNQKKPIIRTLEPRVFCGVRMGGMGVAIGTLVGEELGQLALNE